MREILNEIVKQTNGLFENLRITATEEETKVQAVLGKVFLNASLKPCPQLLGRFGLANLQMLHGLLEFASYKTEGAKLTAKRHELPKVGETVVSLHFQDQNGTGAKFATVNADIVSAATVGVVPWEVEITPTKAKIAEFSQLTSLYKSVGAELFRASVENKNLIFSFGENNETTHNANINMASDVIGKLSNESGKYSIAMFLNIVKMASLNGTVPKVGIHGKGMIGVSVNTDLGSYNYTQRVDDGKQGEKKK
jgi:hypothetical protein